jgi:GTP-binding protein YchF
MKRVGLLGLPQSGKSTVFDILLMGAGAAAPASHGRESVGVVRVPDPRLDRLAALYQPKRTVYAQIQFVDTVATVAGSTRSAAKGQDLFSAVRNCDALAAVVAHFDDASDPTRDLRTLEAELILNDLALVEGRLERIDKELRVGKRQNEREHALLTRCKTLLEGEHPLRDQAFEPEEDKQLRGFQLLTLKSLLIVDNQGDVARAAPAAGAGAGREVVTLRALLEREVLALPPAERESFRSELGIGEDGLSVVIRACYHLLGLQSFFTVGEDECRAWTVSRSARAVEAAGEIHSDLAKGFIRAEVVPWDKLLEAGSEAKARERAWMRLEGRDYEVQDGDCITVRFNK